MSMFGEIVLGSNLALSSTNPRETRGTPFSNLCRRVGTRVMPAKPIHSHSIRKLCWELPVRFHVHSDVMPKNSCTLPNFLSKSYAGNACTFSLQFFSKVIPGNSPYASHSLESDAGEFP